MILNLVKLKKVRQVTILKKIKAAKSLLDAGIISEEEFEEIKKKIIDNI